MTRGHKSRCQGRISRNPLELAKAEAARLTATEIAEPIACLRIAARALREGVATEWQWMLVATSLDLAQAIEQLGVVRGLSGHLHAAELALQGIYQRAMTSGAWCCTALYYQEPEDVTTMVDLHQFQLEQLSYGEFRRAIELVNAYSANTAHHAAKEIHA